MRGTVQTSFQHLHKSLLSLGYTCAKENHYRKQRFHVIVHPKNGRVELHIHVDNWFYGPPLFQHHSRKTGRDISQEYHRIIRALNPVGSCPAKHSSIPSCKHSSKQPDNR